MIELAKQYKLRIFVPSTIGAFGPDSPRNPTPNVTVIIFKTTFLIKFVNWEFLNRFKDHEQFMVYQKYMLN